MAGIVKINMKDITSIFSKNQTVSLQKCLDSNATCLLVVNSVKNLKSRVLKSSPI
jgi:hypothetical protein